MELPEGIFTKNAQQTELNSENIHNEINVEESNESEYEEPGLQQSELNDEIPGKTKRHNTVGIAYDSIVKNVSIMIIKHIPIINLLYFIIAFIRGDDNERTIILTESVAVVFVNIVIILIAIRILNMPYENLIRLFNLFNKLPR